MKVAKSMGIPQQLRWMLGVAVVMTLVGAAFYYVTWSREFKGSSARTVATVETLTRNYQLLESVSANLNGLQTLLRLKDPDEIEKSIGTLKTNQQQIVSQVSSFGPGGRAIQETFDSVVRMEGAVLDEFLKGNAGLAYEQFLGTVSPQSSALLNKIRQYNQEVENTAHQDLLLQKAHLNAKLKFWLGGFVTVLAAVTFVGWLLKNRILTHLAQLSGNLAGISNNTATASNQIASASQKLADSAGHQASALEQIRASLEEMSGVTHTNSESTRQANDLARQTRSAAEKGATDMRAMSEAILGIKQASDDISQIIRTIDEIAFQTNILALNAAVEAARAGEAGMGFAVVADEVRNLAQRSATAAKETADKIEGAIRKTGDGVNISKQVAEALDDIVAKARQVDKLSGDVASSSVEQTERVTQINSAVEQLDNVTQGNAAGAEEGAASAAELHDQAEALKESVDELLAMVGSTGTHEATIRSSAKSEPVTSELHSRSKAVPTRARRVASALQKV